jgi:CheY-like chemotaxis protein
MGDNAAAKRKVLIIDDNLDAAETLASLLQAVGYVAVFRTDGPTGIAVATQWLPHAILLDIGMPIMNGFEVARALRQCPALDQCRIIALSAWNDPETVALAASSGFDAHIAKPASLASLLRELERAQP